MSLLLSLAAGMSLQRAEGRFEEGEEEDGGGVTTYCTRSVGAALLYELLPFEGGVHLHGLWNQALERAIGEGAAFANRGNEE